jgi:hypothetical protein
MWGMKMNRTFLTPTVVHPNLGATSNEGVKGAYDVVIAKEEKFITPDGKQGRVRVFSRVSPERIFDDKSGKLQACANKARDKINDVIKGDLIKSSSKIYSADAFYSANKGFQIPVQKQVRFVDAANAEIPRNNAASGALPKEVILPELPPDI